MLTSNTMRFCTDLFGMTAAEIDEETGASVVEVPFKKQALLVSKVALDCSQKSEVTKIIIGGSEPTGTKRRFLFQIDNKVWKFNGSTLAQYTGTLNADNVLNNGNTAAQLNALTNITGFIGKKVYPIIALEAAGSADDMPTAKVQLTTKTATDILTKTAESPAYELTNGSDPARLVEITADTTCAGGGSVDIKVRLRDADNVWSDYMTLANATDKEAFAVQFKITYKVNTVGTDSAKVNSITVNHTFGKALVSGDNADLYTIVNNYEVPLQMCYAIVRHEPLQDAYIDAYVNFMKAPKHRDWIILGTATGSSQELTLGVDGVADPNVVASSIEILIDDKPLTNFSFNSEVSTVVLSAKKNSVIYASYDYDHDSEVWRKMTAEVTEPFNDADGTYTTRYVYSLPDSEATDKKIANVRLQLVKRTGRINQYQITVATGKRQLFVLKHKPLPSTISFTQNVDWSYDENSSILSFVAAAGTPVVISDRWQGVAPVVRSFAAGFAVA